MEGKEITVKGKKKKDVVTISRTDAAVGPINIEALIVKAMDGGMAPETIQKFLDMRKQLKDEYAREAFYLSLANFQAAMPTIKKTKPVYEKGTTHVRYKYATLDLIIEQVKKPLQENGFSYTNKAYQPADKPGKMVIATEAHHSAGHTETTTLEVDIAKSGFMSAVQELGSAMSYLKRYTFCAAFGIMTGDEDVDGADKKTQTKPGPAAAAKEEKKPAPAAQPAAAAKPAPAPEAKPKKDLNAALELARQQATKALAELYAKNPEAAGVKCTKEQLLAAVMNAVGSYDLKGKKWNELTENQLYAVRAAALNWK